MEENKKSSCQVLLIDDDEAVGASMAALFKSLGQQLEVARNGAAGLELIKAKQYDLVMTDMGMPGLDGCTLTRAIKTLRPRLPVAVVSGWSETEIRERLAQEDVRPDFILEKPLTSKAILALLSTIRAGV